MSLKEPFQFHGPYVFYALTSYCVRWSVFVSSIFESTCLLLLLFFFCSELFVVWKTVCCFPSWECEVLSLSLSNCREEVKLSNRQASSRYRKHSPTACVVLQSLVAGRHSFSIVYKTSYTMPSKIQPIRIQESHCILDSITSNLLIVLRVYVDVLATVFSMAWWYKIVMERSFVVYHGIFNESLKRAAI